MTLDELVVHYLRDFPHRNERMEMYGVCRDWMKKVLLDFRRRTDPDVLLNDDDDDGDDLV